MFMVYTIEVLEILRVYGEIDRRRLKRIIESFGVPTSNLSNVLYRLRALKLICIEGDKIRLSRKALRMVERYGSFYNVYRPKRLRRELIDVENIKIW